MASVRLHIFQCKAEAADRLTFFLVMLTSRGRSRAYAVLLMAI